MHINVIINETPYEINEKTGMTVNVDNFQQVFVDGEWNGVKFELPRCLSPDKPTVIDLSKNNDGSFGKPEGV